MLHKIFVLTLFLFIYLSHSEEYNRKDWGSWQYVDCQDTRQRVLIQESLTPVVMDKKGCRVISGRWICLYTGKIIEDPTLLDIDHMVPLREVFESNGNEWDYDKKKLYFNYLNNPQHLIAVDKSANRSKGDRSPDQWMPPFTAYTCSYLKDWVNIKDAWNLKMDDKEKDFIIKSLTENKCYETW